MPCKGFEKFARGVWTQEAFQQHLETCAECREAYERDKQLLDLSRSLKTDVEAPLLWSRIESELKATPPRVVRASDNYKWALRIAAILLVAIGMTLLVRQERSTTSSGLLAGTVLEKVEAQEKAYEAAIAELETVVQPQLSQLDQELMLLYRDRLETIDAQIEQCKTALATNPANAHIRRYLLAALKDKKQTLTELLELEKT